MSVLIVKLYDLNLISYALQIILLVNSYALFGIFKSLTVMINMQSAIIFIQLRISFHGSYFMDLIE